MTRSAVIPLPKFFILFVASLVALGPLSIDTYLPAIPSMARALAVDIVQVNHTLSIYFIGFAIGQIIGGPISDQVGRKIIGLIGLVLFTVCSLVIAFTTHIEMVIALRGLQAIGGGFATVICMAMVRDAYPPEEAAKQFPRVMLVMLSAPLLAPAIGSAMLSLGWASIFVFLTIYGLIMLSAFTFVPETAVQRSGEFKPAQIFPQYIAVLTRRVENKLVPLRWIFAQGLIASLMFVFITHSAFIYLEYFAIEPAWFAFYFGANVVAMMIGTTITTRLIHRYSPFRLYSVARAIQLAAIVTLTVLATTTEISLIVFTALLALAVGCNGVINPSVQGMYLAQFHKLAGSATSLMSMAMFSFGSLLGLISSIFFDGTLTPTVFTMLAALVTGNVIAMTIPDPHLTTRDVN